MAAQRAGPVKSPSGLTVRCAFRRAQRFQIRIGRGQRGEFRIERDRAFDAGFRRLQIAALTGVATKIELNRRLGGMLVFRREQNLFRGFERIGAPRGIGERHPDGRIDRRAADQLAREIANGAPVALFVQHGESHGQDLRAFGVGALDAGKLRRGFGDHAELEITLGVRKASLEKHRSWAAT
jgi:hypothetical protein